MQLLVPRRRGRTTVRATRSAEGSSRRTRLALVALVVWVLLLVVPSGAWAVERVAVPSTLGAVLAVAQPGDEVVLGAGDYGRFRGVSKPGLVTIRAAAGAPVRMSLETGPSASNLRLEGVTISGGYVNGGRNLQFVDARFTGYLRVDAPGADHAIVFDGVSFDGIDLPGNAYEGRLSIRGYDNDAAVGVTVRNSHFGGGGCSDGVQIIGGANGVRILDNTFADLRQGACGPHVDAIQGYGTRNTLIDGNYFRNVDQAVGFYDGGAGETITDNVIVGVGGQAVQMGQISGLTFSHNTVRNTTVSIGSKTNTPSTATVRDNVLAGAWFQFTYGGGCNCNSSNNLLSGAVFVGGANPLTYAGHKLAVGSPGVNAATDGTDQGARIGTVTPTPTPTPDPTPTPSPDPTPTPDPTPAPDQPAVAVWTAPLGATVGSAVTLDGSASQGDRPLSCSWRFENQDGSTIWETINGCTIEKAFRYADTKYITLTVRDDDGDTDSTRHSFPVTHD